jgi:hypothetical protein
VPLRRSARHNSSAGRRRNDGCHQSAAKRKRDRNVIADERAGYTHQRTRDNAAGHPANWRASQDGAGRSNKIPATMPTTRIITNVTTGSVACGANRQSSRLAYQRQPGGAVTSQVQNSIDGYARLASRHPAYERVQRFGIRLVCRRAPNHARPLAPSPSIGLWQPHGVTWTSVPPQEM